MANSQQSTFGGEFFINLLGDNSEFPIFYETKKKKLKNRLKKYYQFFFFFD